MKTNRNTLYFYLFVTGFLVFIFFLLLKKPLFFRFSPVIPIAGIVFLSLFFYLDKILLFIAFLTPLSVNLKDSEMTLGVALPTEPLMLGVLVFFLIKTIYDRNYEKKILQHPVTIAIFFYLIWMLITSISSQDTVISFKFFLAKLWVIGSFYFLGIVLFKKRKNIKYFYWLYIIPFIGVIIYTTYRHSQYFFDRLEGNLMSRPFYNDHTAYGAALAMFIPVLFFFSVYKGFRPKIRFFSFIVFAIFLVAIFLSYSRAAWLSVVFAFGIYIIIKLRINYKIVLTFGAIFLGVFLYLQSQIIIKLQTNKQESSGEFVEHVQSMTNVSSDDSNLERLNRWQSAFRMFEDRPFLGWGPGTYQVFYAPFQRSYEKTLISTDFGDRGNAHSEYIGPLAESGVLGLLSVLILVGTVIWTALTTLQRLSKGKERVLLFCAFLGLLTYFAHGILNNFLDTDKLSVPFWGFIGIIVAIDLYHSGNENERLERK